jgi:hypothetical protein
MKKILILLLLNLLFLNLVTSQEDNAGILLDLKKARASYEIAKEKSKNDEELYNQKAISLAEFNNSKNEFLSKEVDYQKLILKLISQQSYVILEKALKYQTTAGEKRVKVTLRSSVEGNQDYLKQFEKHFDVFTPEMQNNKIYNIYVSLCNIGDNTIISSPYEMRVPQIEYGGAATADFGLLRDVESLQVVVSYNGKKDLRNILLEKEGSAGKVGITSSQFAQEADLGASTSFDLTLERFSNSDENYFFVVTGLPKQVSYEFFDSETNARLSQLKFNQGVNTRKFILKTYLPEIEDNEVGIDKTIEFRVLIISASEKAKNDNIDNLPEDKLNALCSGNLKLELIPKGIGRILVKAPSLYAEIKVGDKYSTKITVKNDGTRELNNIKVLTDNPLNWKSEIKPEIIPSLAQGKEVEVSINIIPPDDVNVGAQEIKIKTEAMANNKRVESDDKTLRIQVEAKTPIFSTILLILLLVGVLVGIVVFGIKISKR